MPNAADAAAARPGAAPSAGPAALPGLPAPRRARVANRRLALAACVLAALALIAIVVAGLSVSERATLTDFSVKNEPPSLEHPFGTDQMGRDMFLRTLSGLATSVLIGLLAAGVSSVIALVLGAAAALGGK